MDQKPLNLAIVGCGTIAELYARSLQPYPQLHVLGATSRTLKHAEDFVATFGGNVYPSLEAVVADEEVDLVINLTIHSAQVEVITTCLHAGKHVYSEKPMALTSEEAWKLVALAEEKGCRLGSAPITILGEGQLASEKALELDPTNQISQQVIPKIKNTSFACTEKRPFVRTFNYLKLAKIMVVY